jgi:hypothetical protein
MIKIVHDRVGVSNSLPPGPCDASFIASGDWSHTSTTVNQPVWQDYKKVDWLLHGKDETSLQLVERRDSIRGTQIKYEIPILSISFFLTHSFIIFESTTIQTGKPGCITALGGYQD